MLSLLARKRKTEMFPSTAIDTIRKVMRFSAASARFSAASSRCGASRAAAKVYAEVSSPRLTVLDSQTNLT